LMRVAVETEDGLWQVAVGRALGGSEWRDAGIIDVADCEMVRLEPRHRFLVLATDGVWGPLDKSLRESSTERSEPVAFQVAGAQAAGSRAGDIAQGLVRCAERECGSDNASCVVLLLGRPTRGVGAAAGVEPQPGRVDNSE
jgi:serine/threonine protein phosphatase PrpC